MKYKTLILVAFISLAFQSCSGRIGASFYYKYVHITPCKECDTSTNAFYVSFRKPVSISGLPLEKGVGKMVQKDRYTIVVNISKAYKEKPVIKKVIKQVKRNIK